MAKVLFITEEDLKTYSAINGNVDGDKLMQFVTIAQDIHIQGYLGSALYQKFENDIDANTLTGNYKTLMDEYIKAMTIHWSLVEVLPFIAYTIANKGVFKHTSENAQSVTKEEVDFITEKHRTIAQNYTRRFIDYMCVNSALFPEYSVIQNGGVNPSKQSNFGGWKL